jgi:hypothetical protein
LQALISYRGNGYKSSLLVLLAASQALSFIDRVILSVVLPELIKEHAYVASTAGLLMSIMKWFYVGARRAWPGAVAFWSVATSLCALTIQFWPLAVLRAAGQRWGSPDHSVQLANHPAELQQVRTRARSFGVSEQDGRTRLPERL